MEVGNTTANRTTGPRRLLLSTVGELPGDALDLDDLLKQSIVLTINKRPMTAAEIGKAIGVHVGFLEEALEPLVAEEVVTKDGRRYQTNFIALDIDDWKAVTNGLRPWAVELADGLREHLPEMERAWNETSFPAQGFVWEESIWPVLGKLVGMYGVERQQPPTPPHPVHAGSGKAYWISAQERGTDKPDAPVLSWAISHGPVADHVFWFGYITSTYLNNFKVAFLGSERASAMGAIAWGATDTESIADSAGLPIGRTREVIAGAIEVGHIDGLDNSLRLPFPVIGREENDLLFPTVDRVAVRICDVVTSAAADWDDELRTRGYGRFEQQFPAWHRWLTSKIVAEGLRHLQRCGVLPDLEQCPAHCHMLGFKDELPIMMSSYAE